ncbi:MAG: recombinase family protein [Lachnospiraceae bacterium]|nr:recombinase family protein [Lachnospiraceae bacterium]
MQVDGYSLEAQKDRLTKFAEFQDMEVVREYCDAGKSGKSITGRPEFTQMLQDVADDKDGVEYILVFKLSRFGRNAADVLNSLQYIQDFGVNLICVEDGIDSSKDSGKLTITVLSAVAEIERENILVQTMEGRKQKAREGKWNGGQAPFGYTLDSKKGMLLVNPKEAEIVKIIFNKFVNEGLGADSISNYLNQHGYVKTKYRSHELNYFTRSLVRKILDNPVYIGKIAYGKSSTEKIKGTRDQYHRVRNEEFLMAEGLHEAIIDLDLWEGACARREETGVKWVKTHSLEHEHILTGLLKCPVCGVGMSGTVRRRKNKSTGEYKDDFYYRCKHRKKINESDFCNCSLVLNQNELNGEVERHIIDLVNHDDCRAYIIRRMETRVDVSSLEIEREQLRGQLRQLSGAKKKLTDMLDRLDVSDKHYDRKYQDMHDRLDNLYDKIGDIDDQLQDVNEKIRMAYENQITAEQVYQILTCFDKIYFEMTDLEKKEFFRNFIDEIELYSERQSDGRIVKQINFNFPVYYNGNEGNAIRLPDENTVETVVLLSQQNPDDVIEVEIELDELDLTSAESKATYKEIQEYVLKVHGLKVSNLYISQVKRKCGIEVGENYNLPKSEDSRQPQCLEEKEKAIRDALEHFGMV